MAKKVAYILYYDNNYPDYLSSKAYHRCAAFDTFGRAYNEAAADIDWFMGKGAHIEDEWYNDISIARAGAARITMRMPEGDLMIVNITPSALN